MKRSIILLALIITSISFAGTYSGGDGTSGNPYLISTAADMNTLGATSGDWSKCFKLIADINMAGFTGTQYQIIGTGMGNSFTGTFDGDGHVIRNLTYATAGCGDVGLFGCTENAIIKNLGVEDVNISAEYHSDSNEQIISPSVSAGGLVGYQREGSIENCYSTGLIKCSLYFYTDIGGLVGQQGEGSITNCYSEVSINASFSWFDTAGGLVGYPRDSTIANCYSTGLVTISSKDEAAVGGLVGNQWISTITNCYSTSSITASSFYSDVYAGGLVGTQGESAITNSYSTGLITASSDANGTAYAGGLVGDSGVSGTASGCFWDVNSSGLTTSAGGESKTTAQMKTLTTFTDANWDFLGERANGTENIWTINEGVDYPALVGRFGVNKCTVTAGSRINSDKISVSGTMDATAEDFNDANTVRVTIDSNDMVNPCVQTFPINANTFKNDKYSYLKITSGIRKSFTYNPNTGKFAFAAGNLDLSGLGCPVSVGIEIGDYNSTTDIYETVVNGINRPIQILLMMGVKDVLVVDKCTVKQNNKKSDSDQLSVKGAFAVEDSNMSMADRISEGLVVTLGAQQFTIPANQLKAGNGKFTCSKADVTEDGVTAATFNFNLCSFILTIKDANIDAISGDVDFGVAFTDYNEVEQVTLP